MANRRNGATFSVAGLGTGVHRHIRVTSISIENKRAVFVNIVTFCLWWGRGCITHLGSWLDPAKKLFFMRTPASVAIPVQSVVEIPGHDIVVLTMFSPLGFFCLPTIHI